MQLSPFTPLCFNVPKSDGIPSRYVQAFAPTDEILVEVISHGEGEPTAWIEDYRTEEVIDDIVWRSWDINEETTVYYAAFSIGSGTFVVHIDGIGDSQPIRGCYDEAELADTVLIQYSGRDNRSRTDTAFIVDGVRRYFELRVPGGFKDSSWTFGVDNSQFKTPDGDIVELYAVSSTIKKLTIGNSGGCPIWFGEMINRILCCSYVYIDGERYARDSSSVPEINAVQEGVNSFVFSQQVRGISNLKPDNDYLEYIKLRAYADGKYRISSSDPYTLIRINSKYD